MEQLQGLDATFLSTETPNAPMHIGSLLTFAPPHDRAFDFDRYRDFIASRLHASKVFRQRLVTVPLDLGRPFWIRDPDFDLDFHLHQNHHASWPASWPASSRPWTAPAALGNDVHEAHERAAFRRRLRLCESTAAIDGVSAMPARSRRFLSPAVPPERRRSAEGSPDLGSCARSALFRRARRLTSSHRRGALGRSQSEPAVNKSTSAAAVPRAAPMRFTPSTSPGRTFGERIKAIKSRRDRERCGPCGLAGGFRRLLLRENELPGKPLVAMTPISVRSQDARGTMGNQVSAMLVSLATDEADPLKRLDAIRMGARDSKMYHHAMGARTIMDVTDAMPFSLTGRAARLYSELQLSRFHAPPFNVVLTNVLGPQTPLYTQRAPPHECGRRGRSSTP
jgi:hypothetical protein